MSRLGTTWMAAGLVLAALVPCPAIAQAPAGQVPADTGKPAAEAPGMPAPPTGVPAYVNGHARALNLTSKQVDRVKKVHEWLRGTDSTLRAQWNQITGGRSWRAMPPADRRRLGPQLQPVMQELRANNKAALDSVDAILTPQQQEKLQQMFAEYRARRTGQPAAAPQH